MKSVMLLLNIIVEIVGVFCIYFTLKLCLKKEIKIKIKAFFIKIKEKILKLNYIKQVQNLLENIENLNNLQFKFLNSFTVFIISVFIAIITFIYVLKKYNLFVFAIFCMQIVITLPLILLEVINLISKNNLKISFSLYVISLQSFAKNSNDVIMALNNTKALKPLDKYINEFLRLVNIGFNINKAFDNLIKKIKSKEIAKFFYLLNLSYLNGGNLYEVINRYNSYYSDLEKIKKIQTEKRNSYLLTMLFLLIMNVFLLFSVVLGNESYKSIMQSSILGKIIIDVNVLVYIIVLFLVIKIIRMEE